MKTWISVLSGLLVVQLVAAVAVNLGGDDYGTFEPRETLLALGDARVDSLRIADGTNAVVLALRDGKWVLPELANFPADQGAVERLLDRLAGLEKGWPVATTAGASRRFRVAGDDFERKLTLSSGEATVAELYVGTSPGFRKVHVRPADEEAVFAVSFDTWEAGAGADDWVDKSILALDESRITRVELGGVVLERHGDDLVVAGLAEDQETNTEAARAVLGGLAGLRIDSVLGKEDKPGYRREAPDLEVSVSFEDGKELVYGFSKREDEDDYVLERSDLDHYFRIPEYSVKPLQETSRENLVRSGNAADASGDDVAGAPGEAGEPEKASADEPKPGS